MISASVAVGPSSMTSTACLLCLVVLTGLLVTVTRIPVNKSASSAGRVQVMVANTALLGVARPGTSTNGSTGVPMGGGGGGGTEGMNPCDISTVDGEATSFCIYQLKEW